MRYALVHRVLDRTTCPVHFNQDTKRLFIRGEAEQMRRENKGDRGGGGEKQAMEGGGRPTQELSKAADPGMLVEGAT